MNCFFALFLVLQQKCNVLDIPMSMRRSTFNTKWSHQKEKTLTHVFTENTIHVIAITWNNFNYPYLGFTLVHKPVKVSFVLYLLLGLGSIMVTSLSTLFYFTGECYRFLYMYQRWANSWGHLMRLMVTTLMIKLHPVYSIHSLRKTNVLVMMFITCVIHVVTLYNHTEYNY